MIVTVLLCTQSATAQELLSAGAEDHEPPYLYLGVIGGYSLINNNTSLLVYENLPLCGQFTGGSAQAPFFGITVDYPLLDFIEVSGRLLYARRPARLTVQDGHGWEALDPIQQKIVPTNIEYAFTADLRYLVFDAGIKVLPFAPLGIPLPLYFRAAADAGNPMFGNSTTTTEEIIAPESRLFPDATKRRTLFTGELQNAGTQYGASGAVGMDLRVSRNLSACFEAGFRQGLNSVVSNQEWKTNAIFGALNIRYIMRETLPPVEPPPPPPEVKPEPKPVAKKEPLPLIIESYNTVPLEVQETVVTETYPLLPYIFFDSTSAALRERYKPDVNIATFSENALPKQTLTIYYNALNILAQRLKQNPTAKLTITGTTDGRELPTAAQRKKLADDRAKAVASYLTTVWSIPAERLTVIGSDIPVMQSNPMYAEGLEENRRVEFASETPALLAPVVHSKFMEYTPVQNKQQFSVKALRPERARAWDSKVAKNGITLAQLSGTALPERISYELDSAVMVKLGGDIKTRDSLAGSLSVLQDDGSSVQALCAFPIIKSLNKFELSRLSLIVFDFDRARINDHNRTMMERFVKEAIQPDSKVFITGSTDRLGELSYNMSLSQNRADATKNYLLELNPASTVEYARGIGASKLPYDNNLPEGRYYCRTVSIVVQTPVKK